MLISDFLSTDYLPDGNLEKPVWATAEKVHFDQDAFQKLHQYPDIATMVASRWTRRYLYLAFWCRYITLHTFEGEDPKPERWKLWDRDVVEAFISPWAEQRNRYYEFEIAPNNQWLDLAIDLDARPKPIHNMQWNSGFEHATKIDPSRRMWMVELRIPVESMGISHLEPGMEWRLNFYRADGIAGDGGQRLLSWRGMPIANGSFHQPASFGLLKFIRTTK
ncbi:MAG: carbohydrate-binding family 9-like protein [Acidobacteriaceae bacterium]